MDDEKPPIRRLVLKRREVDPIDTVSRPGDGTAISVRLIHLQNTLAEGRPAGALGAVPAAGPDDAGDGSGIFKRKVIDPLDPPSAPGDAAAISIPVMLRENHASADATPELIAMPPRRKSRRHRDFILLVSCALLAVGALTAVFRHDTQMVGLALFGIVFLTVILAWIMYGVMDRY